MTNCCQGRFVLAVDLLPFNTRAAATARSHRSARMFISPCTEIVLNPTLAKARRMNQAFAGPRLHGSAAERTSPPPKTGHRQHQPRLVAPHGPHRDQPADRSFMDEVPWRPPRGRARHGAGLRLSRWQRQRPANPSAGPLVAQRGFAGAPGGTRTHTARILRPRTLPKLVYRGEVGRQEHGPCTIYPCACASVVR